jgi:SAM-dependent methyltransferase
MSSVDNNLSSSSSAAVPASRDALKTSSSSAAYTYLDPSKRPDALKGRITSAFDRIVGQTRSSWGLFNGNSSYQMCGVKEHQLMKRIILEAYPAQKEFYALDVGAGDFQFNQGLAKYLNEQTDLPDDIKIHIIGIRGESNSGAKVVETGRCKTYNLGAFKAEELSTQFKELGLDLENKIDMAVSHWCFNHFADPVGTFVQTYNLLRPNTGFFLVDGFQFLHENENRADYNQHMTQLLFDTRATFLTRPYNAFASLNQFIMRRPDDRPCQLPMSYVGCRDYDWSAGTITEFKRRPQLHDEGELHPPPIDKPNQMRGDKALHDWLKENRLLDNPAALWHPLQDKDKPRETPPLHKAILAGDKAAIAECLATCDINESDSQGNTALHIAIQKQDFELFKLLLSKGADIGLFNGEGSTPLHEAAIQDKEGIFLQSLIDAGADVKAKAQYYHSVPMEDAIWAKNFKAIELLLKAKAPLSLSNYNRLRTDKFSSIHPLLPKMPHETEDFEKIVQHIQQGNCVFFRYAGRAHGHLFQPKETGPNETGQETPSRNKLLIVDVYLDTPLLEYLELISERTGYDHSIYDPNSEGVHHYEFPETSAFSFGYAEPLLVPS